MEISHWNSVLDCTDARKAGKLSYWCTLFWKALLADVQCTRILTFKWEMVTNNGHTKLYVLKHIMDFRNFLNKHTCFFVSFFYLFHDTISEAFLMSCRLLCSIFLQEKNLHYSISDSQIYISFLDCGCQWTALSIIYHRWKLWPEEPNDKRQPTEQEAQLCHAMYACGLI